MLITDISVGKRIRRETGDISSLAASMESIGLLQPVVVDSDNRLVAGYRRICAAKQLGWNEIRVYKAKSLADALSRLRAERDENTCRKDLLPSEAVAATERLRPLEEKEAKKRQEATRAEPGQQIGKRGGKLPPPIDVGKSRDKLAATVGMSGRTLEKAKAVVESGDAKLIDEMDRSGKVNGAFKKLKTQEKAKAIASEPPPLPAGPFRVIVVDPPWQYESRSDDPSHRAANPYPSMSVDQIKDIDVEGLAEKDAILWLWTTNAFLREAFDIVEAWGFTYKTLLTWVKQKMGTGDWLRGKTEHCLMCVRGKPTIVLTNQTTVLTGNMRKHSQKPEEFYAMVEAMCPGSKAELFQRIERAGWIGHGDEVS